ncbi:hypothetical protein E4U42_003617 [Claviceps africana]|uniref:2EXR domain-containing protein n=1 Tax=Claviceps africana TaxID=83212 RepID=A0A8K0NP88_9HYPO|nr:hypothetical protein E4U42_003617 [Claviceps africana]
MLSTFYHFQKLPLNVRRRIWEFALRRSDRGGGLHYFSVTLEPFNREEDGAYTEQGRRRLFEKGSYRGDTVLRVNVPGYEYPPAPTRNGNKSVYLWDHGLWAACRESRRVMEDRCARDRRLTASCRPEWREYHDEYAVLKRALTTDDRAMRVMFQPYRDVFCLGYKDLDTALLRTSDPLGSLFLEPAREGSASELSLNLALEYHPSWKLNWPRGPEAIREEGSPRGVLARLIEKTFVDLWQISIWLIDRRVVVDATTSPGAQNRPLFHDMDVEYVNVKSGSQALNFIWDLGALLAPMYDVWTGVEAGPMQDGSVVSEVNLEDYVQVLACRKK